MSRNLFSGGQEKLARDEFIKQIMDGDEDLEQVSMLFYSVWVFEAFLFGLGFGGFLSRFDF